MATLSWLAQLTTVWVSGYLESACREAVLAYTSKRANENVVNYVRGIIYESSEIPQFPLAENLGKSNYREDLRGMTRRIRTGATSALIASSNVPFCRKS